MNYEEILTRALRISWRHKYLWLLALFAGEGAAFGLPGFGGPGSGRPRRGGAYSGSVPTAAEAGAWIAAHAGLLWAAAIVLAILAIGLFLVSAVADGALIRGAAEHDGQREFGLDRAWRAGASTFWPMLGLKALSALTAIVLLAVIGSFAGLAVAGAAAHQPAVAVPTGAGAALLLLLAIPFWVVFDVAVRLGLRAVALEGMRPWAGLRAGIALIRRRPGRVAAVWLLVGLVGFLLGLAVRLAVLVVAVPLAAIVAAAYFGGGAPVAIAAGAVLGLAWLALAAALLAGVSAYTSTAWTLAYNRFDSEPAPAATVSPAPA